MTPTKLLPLGLALAVLAMATARGWTSDDAFITFRVAGHWLAGNGPVFNVGERVQVYTHPLWLLVLTAASAVGIPLFPGVAWLSLAVFGAGLLVLFHAFRDKPLALVAVALLLVLSRTAMDFATGGLETPASFALAAGAVAAWRSGRNALALGLLALLPLNRLDLLPWALPFAWLAAPATWRGRIVVLAVLAGPATLWAIGSTIYYGAPFPNTAVAKLGGDLAGRLDQGLAYAVVSLATDPGALALVVAAVVAGVMAWRGRREALPDAPLLRASLAAAAIGLAYAVWAGGDFMLGRFLLPTLWAGAFAVLAAFPAGSVPRAGQGAAATLALLGVLHVVTGQSATNLWLKLPPDSPLRAVGFVGATDERRVYIPWLGLWSRLAFAPPAAAPEPGKPLLAGILGRPGWFGPRDQPLVDIFALADPLLARVEPLPNSRPGHAFRPLPRDFMRWREPGFRFADPRLEMLARDVRLAHLSPDLWSADRFAAIARLLQAPPLAQKALRVSESGDAWQVEIDAARIFRHWDAAHYQLWLRLYDPARLSISQAFPEALDRDCRVHPVPRERSEQEALPVRRGEVVTLRCPKSLLAGRGLLLRVGTVHPAHGLEYEHALEVIRPRLWWVEAVPSWLVQGWSERPRRALVVGLALLLAAAGFAWRARRRERTGEGL